MDKHKQREGAEFYLLLKWNGYRYVCPRADQIRGLLEEELFSGVSVSKKERFSALSKKVHRSAIYIDDRVRLKWEPKAKAWTLRVVHSKADKEAMGIVHRAAELLRKKKAKPRKV